MHIDWINLTKDQVQWELSTSDGECMHSITR